MKIIKLFKRFERFSTIIRILIVKLLPAAVYTI